MIKIAKLAIGLADRTGHPDGHFDKGGRWYPSDTERCSCCESIRRPSGAYPYSLMLHCRSLKHIACLHGVETKELRKAVKAQRVVTKLLGGGK